MDKQKYELFKKAFYSQSIELINKFIDEYGVGDWTLMCYTEPKDNTQKRGEK